MSDRPPPLPEGNTEVTMDELAARLVLGADRESALMPILAERGAPILAGKRDVLNYDWKVDVLSANRANRAIRYFWWKRGER